jgi:ribosomal subunit interface protein
MSELPVTISGIHYKLDDKTTEYVQKKIAKLIDYLPRVKRESSTATVRIEQINGRDGNKYECEIVLTVAGKVLVAKDSTLNALAAVDIAEAKIRGQIRKLKTESGHLGVVGRLRHFAKRASRTGRG